MFTTVSSKLSAGAAGAVLIAVVLTALNLLTQDELLRRAASIAHAVEAVRKVTSVRASLARARRHEQEAIVALAHIDLMEMRASHWSAAMRDTLQALSGLRDGVETDGPVEALQSADQRLHAYESAFNETMDAVKKGLLADPSIADGTMTEARGQADEADRQLAQLAQSLVERSDEAREQMAGATRHARNTSFAVLALFAGIGLAGWALLRRAIIQPLDDAVLIARRVAAGDLSNSSTRARADEFGLLLAALAHMRSRLQELVSGVHHSVDSVASAATQIASGNLDLSARTELQAASLQSASHAVHRVSESLVLSAESAQTASDHATTMFDAAQRDGERVAQVVHTMQDIQATTLRIQTITGLIDGLALQTHILGLNAAVEASNAGERGRSFGVVASGVRDLAERSRAAAGEVRALVADAAARVDGGMALAREAGEGISALIARAGKVAQHIDEMRRAALAQRDDVAGIGADMVRIDNATQQNAALVEEAAAAAQGLDDQARQLAQSVAAFKLS